MGEENWNRVIFWGCYYLHVGENRVVVMVVCGGGESVGVLTVMRSLGMGMGMLGVQVGVCLRVWVGG